MSARSVRGIASICSAVAVVLTGLILSIPSAGALGTVTQFCTSDLTAPSMPNVSAHPSKSQMRALEVAAGKEVHVLREYATLAPTQALATYLSGAATALSREVSYLKAELVQAALFAKNHKNHAARARGIADLRNLITQAEIYGQDVESAGTLANQACATTTTTTTTLPATTTTTIATTTTTTTPPATTTTTP